MTVALLGVGADSTNASPTPPVYPDDRFEYVPIPESAGPDGTTEERTYGTAPLRHRDRSMAEFLDSIRPQGTPTPEYEGERLAAWPLHHDPNFGALTYGESQSRGAYVRLLRELSPGDAVAFYTGLRGESPYRHRYLIGHFTVREVLDCRRIEHDGDRVAFGELPPEKRAAVMDAHAANAHAKRFEATGEISGDGLVIVDGDPPGGRLERAVRISDHRGGGHHYLTDALQERLSPVSGGNPERNAYLGGIKKAHKLRIDPAAFRDLLPATARR